MLIKETSERSKKFNSAEKQVKKLQNVLQVEFEGISTKNNNITCLIDRGLYNGKINEIINEDIYFQLFTESEPFWKIKLNIVKQINVPWLFVIYSYIDNKCLVFDVSNILNEKKIFNSFEDFGNWFSSFTDKSHYFSSYQESGLPDFDKKLRLNGTPWPGNIDGLLIEVENNKLLCAIEYQNTSVATVRNHDNNKYIYASAFRKGDNKRWMVQERLSKALGVKIIVIVWSIKENEVALKVIDSFNLSSDGLVSHINWGNVIYIDTENINLNIIKKLL